MRRPTASTRALALDAKAADTPVVNDALTTMSQLMKMIMSPATDAAAALKLREKDQNIYRQDGAAQHWTRPYIELSRGVPNSLYLSATGSNRTRGRPAAQFAAAASSANSTTSHGGVSASQLSTAKRVGGVESCARW